MSDRVIKESIKRSPQIDQLTWFEEVVYYRMILTADDNGVLDGRSVVLKSDLFPTKESITNKAMQDAVNKLEKLSLIERIRQNDREYLHLTTWAKYQTASAAGQPAKPTPKGHAGKKEISPYSQQFETFWAAYPRKTGKGKAWESFEKYDVTDELLGKMLETLEAAKRSAQWRKDGGQFIPHPSTWLNQRRWEDEIPQTATVQPSLDERGLEDWDDWK